MGAVLTRCARSASTSTTAGAARCRSPSTARRACRAARSSIDASRVLASSSRRCCWPAPATSAASTCATTASRCRRCPHIEMTVAHAARARRGRRRRRRPTAGAVAPGPIARASTRRSSRTCPTPRRSWRGRWSPAARVHGAATGRGRPPGRRRAARPPGRDGRARSSSPTTGLRGRRRPARLHGVDVDLHDVGELTPVVAALCALADSPVAPARHRAHPRPRDRPAGGPRRRARPPRRRRRRARRTACDRAGAAARRHRSTPTPTTGWRTPARSSGSAVAGVEVEDVATTAKTLPGLRRASGRRCCECRRRRYDRARPGGLRAARAGTPGRAPRTGRPTTTPSPGRGDAVDRGRYTAARSTSTSA